MRRIAVSAVLLMATPALVASPPPAERSGAEVFATVCSMCHVEESATPMRAPLIPALRRLTANDIREALTLGEMVDVGNGLSDKEIDNVAAFLTAPPAKSATPAPGP